MGFIDLFINRRQDPDYGKILETLETSIRDHELGLESIFDNERKVQSTVLFYTSASYILGIALFLYAPITEWQSYYLYLCLLVATPFLIIFVRVLITRWFLMLRRNQIKVLTGLRKQQAEKIEDLKKKTGFYTTKGLLDKYETPPKNANQRQLMGTPLGTPLGTPAMMPLKQKTPKSEPNTWFDKALDAIVGKDGGPEHKYALICESCFVHNGLVLSEEYLSTKFKCISCDHFNSKLKAAPFAKQSSSLTYSPNPFLVAGPAVVEERLPSKLSRSNSTESVKTCTLVAEEVADEPVGSCEEEPKTSQGTHKKSRKGSAKKVKK